MVICGKKKEEVFIFESRVQAKKKMLNEMLESTRCRRNERTAGEGDMEIAPGGCGMDIER